MTQVPAKFRKKPVVIEAIPFDGTFESGKAIIEWIMTYKRDRWNMPTAGDGYLMIHTLEGTMSAESGDWIIKGVQDEFYPCKPDIFGATYEAVT